MSTFTLGTTIAQAPAQHRGRSNCDGIEDLKFCGSSAKQLNRCSVEVIIEGDEAGHRNSDSLLLLALCWHNASLFPNIISWHVGVSAEMGAFLLSLSLESLPSVIRFIRCYRLQSPVVDPHQQGSGHPMQHPLVRRNVQRAVSLRSFR